ncbi:MAG: hypothetical protein Gyms2KO_33880 [Gymnodinialimonas sp.]
MSEDLFQSVPDWSDTLEDVVTGEISFGKRTKPYRFACLVSNDILTAPPLSPNSKFAIVDNSKLHIHGTQLMRGQETTVQFPEPFASGLTFASYDDFLETERSETMSLKWLLPTHLDLRTERRPLLFSLSVDLYAQNDLAGVIQEQKTPGIGFPFPPVTVDLMGGHTGPPI